MRIAWVPWLTTVTKYVFWPHRQLRNLVEAPDIQDVDPRFDGRRVEDFVDLSNDANGSFSRGYSPDLHSGFSPQRVGVRSRCGLTRQPEVDHMPGLIMYQSLQNHATDLKCQLHDWGASEL